MYIACYCLIFLICFLKTSAAEANEKSNFVLINNRLPLSNSSDYRLPREEFIHDFDKLNKILKDYKINFQTLLSFANEQGPEHKIFAKMLLTNGDKLYLLSEEKKLQFLGCVISSDDAVLNSFKSSVANGKIVAAYWKKKNEPVAVVIDEKGLVYSVTKVSVGEVAIEAIGMSSK